MYKTSLFCAILPVCGSVSGYTHHEYFSRFGTMLDEMDAQMSHHRSRFFDGQDATSYSVKQTENAVVIMFNTGKKISPEAINVQVGADSALVTFSHEGRESRITLEQDKGYLVISMCSQESGKRDLKTDQGEAYSAFSGSACASQVIPTVVDFDTLVAEYAGTELTLTVRLQEPVQVKTKKVPVIHREHTQKPILHDK